MHTARRRPQSSECVLMGDAAQLAGDCEASSECVALLLKPGGIINGTPTLEEVGYLKVGSASWLSGCLCMGGNMQSL